MGEQKRILLVDDHKAVFQLLEAIVRVKGYELIYADSGQQGIVMARQELIRVLCKCTVSLCDVAIETIRDFTFISLETCSILRTIKGLLWQRPQDKPKIFCGR